MLWNNVTDCGRSGVVERPRYGVQGESDSEMLQGKLSEETPCGAPETLGKQKILYLEGNKGA